MMTLVPKPLNSGAKAEGRFGKQDFVYIPEDDVYRCPAGELLTWRFNRVEDRRFLRHYWTTACQGCAIKAQCMTGKERRISAGSMKASSTSCSSAARPGSRRYAHPPADGRASVRNHESLNGSDPLPDLGAEASRH
jgi:hypothetical protein